MKRVLSVTLLLTAALLLPMWAPTRAQAQVLCALGPTTPPYDPMADMPASADAQGELKKVKALLCPKGCGKVLLFANATTPNTATVTDGAGVSKIAYSPSFVNSVRASFGPIATLGIFAHDLGHHMDATASRAAWIKESWDAELRADAWAGCAMAKAALSPSRLQAVLLALSTYPSPRHPAWSERRSVITDGYKQCGGRMLPPLAREKAEQGAAIADASKSKDDTAAAPVAAVLVAPKGCSADKDCRNGRACVSGRCSAPPERMRCGKDMDCPEPQECDGSGYCASSTATQSRAEEAPPKPAEKPAAGPVLAALQTQTPAQPPAAKDTSACQRTCDQVRDLCVDAATSEGNKCLVSIQSDPGYRACSCPNYPGGNEGCYRICTSAHERGKGCSTANLVRDCRTDGDRCRSQCQ
jgi:hypothetical protein